ncbi:hypothetical protein LL033_24875 (plasmid) [Clostridium estertheticum]|uniref:hypothetical protein n=1 Tax=Clostridium estertheticum TaxID=238834 RepID=UPI00227ADBE5|nr:hypothetical protein [Clostridium estertheticum]WAG58359.1 hypothetical protein LL033_24875 [Clostridium estertheticum]
MATISSFRLEKEDVNEDFLKHVSPLGWEHISSNLVILKNVLFSILKHYMMFIDIDVLYKERKNYEYRN